LRMDYRLPPEARQSDDNADFRHRVNVDQRKRPAAKQPRRERMSVGKKPTGAKRDSSPTKPAVIDTPQGPILVYRLPRGKVGIMHAPAHRVLKPKESLTFKRT
jgi:hypothetical protein